MQNIFKKTSNHELTWFAKRFNALVVPFPSGITAEIIKKDPLCSIYSSDTVFNALIKAHCFIKEIVSELSDISEEGHFKYVLSKLDLIWAVCHKGELKYKNNAYCLYFKKPLSVNYKTFPDNYTFAFKNICDNGCFVEYLKENEQKDSFKNCESGFLYFDNEYTALGLYLFVKKVSEKRWYWKEDLSGGFSKSQFNPLLNCVEPFYRADMRVFCCGERLKIDVFEQFAGYSDEMIGYFKIIYDFAAKNYPECLPYQAGFYNYIDCSVAFSAGKKYSMLGQLGIGTSENFFVFYGALSGEVKEKVFSEIYRLNGSQTDACRDWFAVQAKEDAERAVEVMKIKAEYGKNIIPAKNQKL